MGIFSKIKEAIFGRKAQAQQADIPAASGGIPAGETIAAPQPQVQPVVDVEEVLTGIVTAKGNPDLNWRTSIVDLLKLLDMDSSLDNRKELATELGYTGAKDGSAEMNVWLHKEVMRQLAANGGKVPAGLLD